MSFIYHDIDSTMRAINEYKDEKNIEITIL